MSSATEKLIDDFALALKEKAAESEAKHGWNDDWKDLTDPVWLAQYLKGHVEKGDPRDVAIIAAFAWYHCWLTTGEIDMGKQTKSKAKPPVRVTLMPEDEPEHKTRWKVITYDAKGEQTTERFIDGQVARDTAARYLLQIIPAAES